MVQTTGFAVPIPLACTDTTSPSPKGAESITSEQVEGLPLSVQDTPVGEPFFRRVIVPVVAPRDFTRRFEKEPARWIGVPADEALVKVSAVENRV